VQELPAHRSRQESHRLKACSDQGCCELAVKPHCLVFGNDHERAVSSREGSTLSKGLCRA